MEPIVDTPSGLADLVERLGSPRWLALDAEGDGLYRYRSRLCTLQLSDGHLAAVVDTLAIDDLSPLCALLGADRPVKVVHDVSFDVRMLAQRSLALGAVFDTSVAARFLGEPSTGLLALLQKHFDVTLDKDHQQADWGRRPLEPEQVRYLLEDVRHLPALADLMLERAVSRDVREEIDEEVRYAKERALEPERVREPWTRVRGGRDLPARPRAILKALADAREREAQARDVPPFRVASNRVLMEAARRNPQALRDLRRIRGLRSVPDDALEGALRAARRDGPPTEEAPSPPPPEVRARRKAAERALTEWRATEAERRGVDPQVVLPGHCLRDIASLEAPDAEALEAVAGFGDKRMRLYAGPLIELVRGL